MGYTPNSYKRFLASTVAVAVAASAAAPFSVNAASSENNKFNDVKANEYFFEAVQQLAKKDIIAGSGNGKYQPNNQVTRAEAAKMLALSLGLNVTSPKEPGFSDVKATDWFYPFVAAVHEAKIVEGSGDQFNPNQPVTRAELAKMLVLGFKLEQETKVDNPFTDVKKEDWFAAYISALTDAKITAGKTATAFDPHGKVTRGQIAAFLHRSMNNTMVEGTIEGIQDSALKINGKSYKLAENYQNLLNPANQSVLQNAKLEAFVKNGTLVKIKLIEISNINNAKELHLDGQNQSFDGDIAVSGDNVKISNLKLNGNLTIGSEVKSKFASNNVTVQGKVTILSSLKEAGQAAEQNHFHKAQFIQAAAQADAQATAAVQPVYEFKDTSLNNVELQKASSAVKFTGTSNVKELKVNASNTSISAATQAKIGKIAVGAQAESLNLDGKAEEISLQAEKAFKLTGKAEVTKLTVNTKSAVSLKIKGSIKILETKNKNTAITLGSTARIEKLSIPEGTKAEDIIKNYQEMKDNVGNQTQAPAAPSTPNAQGPSSGSEQTPPPENNGNEETEPETPTAPVESADNPFIDNGTYTASYLLKPLSNITYGAASLGNNAIVNGDVTVRGDITELTLGNMTINGKLTLDPGDNAEIKLTNINAASIEVLSGKVGTVHFNGVNVAEEVIVKDSNGISLKADGNSSIPNIHLSPSAAQDGETPLIELKGSFLNTNILVAKSAKIEAKENFEANHLEIATGEGEEVKLAGDFSSTNQVVITKPTTVSSQTGAVIPTVEINIPQSAASNVVKLRGDMKDTTVKVKEAVELNMEDTIGKLELEADVTLSGTVSDDIRIEKKIETITVQPKNEAIQTALNELKVKAIELAETAIESLPEQASFENLQDVEAAGLLVKTAYALGAEKGDFTAEKIEKYEGLASSLQAMNTALTNISFAFSQLPAHPENAGLKYLPILEEKVQAAEAALQARGTALTLEQVEVYLGADLYGRLVLGKTGIQALNEKQNFEKATKLIVEVSGQLDELKKGFNSELHGQVSEGLAQFKSILSQLSGQNLTEIMNKYDQLYNRLHEIDVKAAIESINIPETVTENFILPTNFLDRVGINWSSDKPKVISINGQVTRPEVGEDDVKVTLTATASVAGLTETKTFTVIVKAKEDTEEPILTLNNASSTIVSGDDLFVTLNEHGTIYLLPAEVQPQSVADLEELKLSSATSENGLFDILVPAAKLQKGSYKLYAADQSGNISAASETITIIEKLLHELFLDNHEMTEGDLGASLTVAVTTENVRNGALVEVSLIDEAGLAYKEKSGSILLGNKIVGNATITLMNLGNLHPGTYTVKVKVADLEKTDTFIVKPAAETSGPPARNEPMIKGAKTSDTDIHQVGGVLNTFSWYDSKDTSVDKYVILRSITDSVADAEEIGSVAPRIGSYTDKKVVPGTPYYYFIKAVGPNGIAYLSEAIDIKTVNDLDSPPMEPTNGKAVYDATRNGVLFTWEDSPSEDVVGYDIYRFTDENFDNPEAYELVTQNVPPGTQSYFDTKMKKDTYYYYVAVAKDLSGENWMKENMPRVFAGVKSLTYTHDEGNKLAITANYQKYVPLAFTAAPTEEDGFAGTVYIDFSAEEYSNVYTLNFDTTNVTGNGSAVVTVYDNNWTPDPSDDIISDQKLIIKIIDGKVEIVEVIN